MIGQCSLAKSKRRYVHEKKKESTMIYQTFQKQPGWGKRRTEDKEVIGYGLETQISSLNEH